MYFQGGRVAREGRHPKGGRGDGEPKPFHFRKRAASRRSFARWPSSLFCLVGVARAKYVRDGNDVTLVAPRVIWVSGFWCVAHALAVDEIAVRRLDGPSIAGEIVGRLAAGRRSTSRTCPSRCICTRRCPRRKDGGRCPCPRST